MSTSELSNIYSVADSGAGAQEEKDGTEKGGENEEGKGRSS